MFPQKKYSIICLWLLCIFFFPAQALAGSYDNEPGEDSAVVGRIPGYSMESYVREYGRLTPLGPDGATLAPVEGLYTRIDYKQLPNRRQSALAIIRTYSFVFEKKGGSILRDDLENNVAGYRLQKDGKDTYVLLHVYNNGETYSLELLEAGPPDLELITVNSNNRPPDDPAMTGLSMNDGVARCLADLKSQGRTILPISFNRAEDTINPESFAAIGQLCAALRDIDDMQFIIEGYTDNDGNAERNMNLSRRRAGKVATAFALCGIPDARIEAKGMGQEHPIADNDTEAGRKINRRVELVVKK